MDKSGRHSSGGSDGDKRRCGAITAFAEEMVPVTGQNTSNTKWIIIAAVAAVCVILVCVILPKAKKK